MSKAACVRQRQQAWARDKCDAAESTLPLSTSQADGCTMFTPRHLRRPRDPWDPRIVCLHVRGIRIPIQLWRNIDILYPVSCILYPGFELRRRHTSVFGPVFQQQQQPKRSLQTPSNSLFPYPFPFPPQTTEVTVRTHVRVGRSSMHGNWHIATVVDITNDIVILVRHAAAMVRKARGRRAPLPTDDPSHRARDNGRTGVQYPREKSTHIGRMNVSEYA
ncbi:hypothetical protein EVG20_g8803 [Dentipellis fragilis]|uniref:Uncharacterized protein n=1 Tax=Dentipellis fragilis TaxID=205917 RepID=A0A4Y9Y3S5_9AGAM|nr:hypothetical protein EVG20_g8803 [Dentipellis fragilis]